MNFELRKRKSWKDAGGVSEIVGNILILLITVVLFTGIMGFVQTMPVPKQTTKVDFAASMIYTGTGANVTITHEGGAVLPAKTTEVYVEVDTLRFSYILSTDPGFHYTTWHTGLDWTKSIAGITSTSSVTVRVIDMQEHVVLWVSQLSGGTSGTPPSILQRYTDSNPSTPTPDPVKKGNDFSLFVRITDMDNDLNTSGIYVDATSIGMSKSILFQNGTGGWFRWDFKGKTEDVAAVDGKSLVIRAWDKRGHMSVANFVLQITVLPSDTYNNLYPAYSDLGSSGLPAYLRYVSDSLGHGFGIYGENITNGTATGKANTSDARNYFSTHEMVFLRFASLSMSNLFVENRLTMTDIRTGISYTPSFKPSSYSTAAFYPYPTGGSAYVYECKFNTTGLPPGAYALALSLKNQGTGSNPSQAFSANEPIIITDPGSPILPSMVPNLWVYKNSTWTGAWGTRDHPFELSTPGRNVIYVLVKVQNTNAYPPSPTVAEVRVVDMSGESEVYGVPPAGTMLSRIKTFNSTCYNLSIDLRAFNGNQWLPGRNAYTLLVSRLNDTNEGVYSLSTQVWINGTGGKAEWFVGTYGMASGNSNFNTREYQYYIQNNNFFTSRVMLSSESTPSSSTDYTVTALGAGDLDGDGDKDLLIGQASSNKLLMFENTLSLYGTWQAASEISRPDTNTNPVTRIAFGDTGGDGHDDFAYANSANQIVLYNTSYGSTGWIYNPPSGIKWSGTVSKIDLKDITGDGKADLIVLAGGLIYIYDLKYSWDPTLSTQRSNALITPASAGTTVDFDVKDMDGDGMLDIVTVGGTTAPYSGGGNGVNVNYYTTQSGNQKNLSTTDPYTPTYGQNPSTLVTDTKAKGGNALRLQETTSGGNAGKVSATLQFSALTSSPDQKLRIYAKIGDVAGGTPGEVFYVWYSTDGTTFVPIMSIDSTTYKYYNFSLPSSVAGKAIYIRFTDSDTSSSSTSPQDYIDLDLVGIFSGEFKGFTGSSVLTETTWQAVRGGNIDGTSAAGKAYREVVVATHDATNSIYGFKVYYWNGVSWTYMAGNPPLNWSTFYVSPIISDAKYPFSTLAPTLFDVVDINGDGLSDVLVCNYTTFGTNPNMKMVSKVGFFMNMYSGSQTWRYFLVRQWSVDQPSGGAVNPYIDTVVCTKLSVTG